jgi:hypothetical protein
VCIFFIRGHPFFIAFSCGLVLPPSLATARSSDCCGLDAARLICIISWISEQGDLSASRSSLLIRKLGIVAALRDALHLDPSSAVTDNSSFLPRMHLSKLQGKRSLGLSALLAQRQSDAKPVGRPQSPGDESSSESKFPVSDDQSFPVEQTLAPVAPCGLDLLVPCQEAFSLSIASILDTNEVQSLPDNAMSSSTGVANWQLYGDQSSGTATWQLDDLLVVPPVIAESRSQHQQAFGAQFNAISPLLTSQAEVNIFYQNSRDISTIFVEKQKKIIVDLNGATASLKLQLQVMQQERDDAVLEASTLHAIIEEHKHEQQTQLLSFSLKILQDEAEMRKLNDKIHAMSSESELYLFALHVTASFVFVILPSQVSAMLQGNQ